MLKKILLLVWKIVIKTRTIFLFDIKFVMTQKFDVLFLSTFLLIKKNDA